MPRESDELPYRTPVSQTGSAVDSTTIRDEINYDTLVSVQKDFQEKMDDLKHDFNSFDLLRGVSKEVANEDMRLQAGMRQGAYEILAPLLESLNTALATVDEKYKTGGA